MERKRFYDDIRGPIHLGRISHTAVLSYEAIINEAAAAGATVDELSLMLATALHEAGEDLVPKRESLNYSVSALLDNFSRERISRKQANDLGRVKGEVAVPIHRQRQIANIVYGGDWGRKNLGNTEPDDGWNMRGAGLVQITGRRNFRVVGEMLGVDLEGDPARALNLNVAAKALVLGMMRGIYTGKKLSDYVLPEQFRAARAIINGDVAKNGARIANNAEKYRAALRAANYSPAGVMKQLAAEKETVMPEIEAGGGHDDTPTPVPALVGGIGAAVLVIVASAWQWLTGSICEWFNLFCGG